MPYVSLCLVQKRSHFLLERTWVFQGFSQKAFCKIAKKLPQKKWLIQTMVQINDESCVGAVHSSEKVHLQCKTNTLKVVGVQKYQVISLGWIRDNECKVVDSRYQREQGRLDTYIYISFACKTGLYCNQCSGDVIKLKRKKVLFSSHLVQLQKRGCCKQ